VDAAEDGAVNMVGTNPPATCADMDKLAMYFFPSFTHVICAHAAKITTAKKTSASCTPFYSRSVPLLNAEDDANRVFKEQEQEQKKKKKKEKRTAAAAAAAAEDV